MMLPFLAAAIVAVTNAPSAFSTMVERTVPCPAHREIDGFLSKRTIDLPGGMQPIAADKFADRQHDWLKETGRGFYAREDSWRDVVCHFLMHGMPSGILNTDIPYGKVKAFHRNSSSSNDVEFVSIGVDGFKQKDSEVYTK